MIFSARFFWFLYHFMQQLPHTENISFLNFVVFFFFYPVWRINIWSSTFKNSSPDIYKTTVGLNRKKDRSLIDVSKLIWWLERSDSKSSLTTIFAISYGISSILSLLECITRSSSTSLEEIKLTAIVKSIFHVSAFWRLID